jgi:hypothetical protein
VDWRCAKWHKVDDGDALARRTGTRQLTPTAEGMCAMAARIAWIIGLVCAGVVADLSACGATGSKSSKDAASPYAPAPDPSAPPPKSEVARHAPWTTEFMKSGMLVADEIEVEGPVGLFDHIATRVDPDVHDQVQRTIPAGFEQQVVAKSGAEDSEIHSQLDQLSLIATRRITVLERPSPIDVVISARGAVFWHDDASKQDKRSEVLRVIGKIAR